MISPSQSPGRRRMARAARWLATAALGGLAVTVTAAAQTQAATPAVHARTAVSWAAARLATTVHPIAVNTKNWTGKAGFAAGRHELHPGLAGIHQLLARRRGHPDPAQHRELVR